MKSRVEKIDRIKAAAQVVFQPVADRGGMPKLVYLAIAARDLAIFLRPS
jgi:hypothetical protein